MTKLYDQRDACELDEAGNFYTKHVCAMTAEELHSKSDIAAELGHRDLQIKQLQESLRWALDNLCYEHPYEWSDDDNADAHEKALELVEDAGDATADRPVCPF